MKTSFRYLVILVVMGMAWAYMTTHRDKPMTQPDSFSNFPLALGDWRMAREMPFDQQTLDMLRPTDYISRRYIRLDGAVADIHVGYYDGAKQAGGIHSPKNCLPGSGWFEVSTEQLSVDMQGQPFNAVASVYQYGPSTHLLLYWFQVAGVPVSDEYAMKIQEVLNSLRYGRRDAAFIRITVPMADSKEKALGHAEDFLKVLHPTLKQFLPS